MSYQPSLDDSGEQPQPATAPAASSRHSLASDSRELPAAPMPLAPQAPPRSAPDLDSAAYLEEHAERIRAASREASKLARRRHGQGG